MTDFMTARRTGNSWLALSIIGLTSLCPLRAASADASTAARALADSLFEDGRKLMEVKDYAHACPKFAESEHLDPGGGTILNLALCHEAEGKNATAWTEFNEALSRAIHDGRPERAARARERIAFLEPNLSHLTVLLADRTHPDVEISVDGVSWSAAMRGAAVPLDPGEHLVIARTAGAVLWTGTILLGASADSKTVEVPLPRVVTGTSAVGSSASPATVEPPGLRVQNSAGIAPSKTEHQVPASAAGRRAAGAIVGGAGVVALGVGVGFGILALSKRRASNAQCEGGCTQLGVNLNNQAIAAAWASDFAIPAGTLALAAGAYLLLISSRATRSPPLSSIRLTAAPFARGVEAMILTDW